VRRFLVRLGIVFLLFSGVSRADGIDAGILTQSIAFTTNSNHKLEVYLNLASRMKLTDINQLWVADITWDWSRAARQAWEQRISQQCAAQAGAELCSCKRFFMCRVEEVLQELLVIRTSPQC
jgi:hypothetical protein